MTDNIDSIYMQPGVHLEGPYISHEKRGAHRESVLRVPDRGMSDLESVYGNLDQCRLFTLAPELPGALGVISELVKRNIVVSVGKSCTTTYIYSSPSPIGTSLLSNNSVLIGELLFGEGENHMDSWYMLP